VLETGFCVVTLWTVALGTIVLGTATLGAATLDTDGVISTTLFSTCFFVSRRLDFFPEAKPLYEGSYAITTYFFYKYTNQDFDTKENYTLGTTRREIGQSTECLDKTST